MLTVDEYLANHPEITAEEMEAARKRTLEHVKSYELSQARKRANVTQVQLAERMGVSQKRVSSIENGELDSARLGTLRRYVGGLGGELKVIAKFPDQTIEVI